MTTKAYQKQKEAEKLAEKQSKIDKRFKESQDRKRKSLQKRQEQRIEKIKQETYAQTAKKYNKREKATLKKKKQKIKNAKLEIKGEATKTFDNRTLRKIKEEARSWFQLYVRLRDSNENGYGNCISTGDRRHYKGANGGHYYGKQNYPHLQFDEDNCFLQSPNENRKQGSLTGTRYKDNVIRRIGEHRFAILQEKAENKFLKQEAKKRDKDYYRMKTIEYREKALNLQKNKG